MSRAIGPVPIRFGRNLAVLPCLAAIVSRASADALGGSLTVILCQLSTRTPRHLKTLIGRSTPCAFTPLRLSDAPNVVLVSISGLLRLTTTYIFNRLIRYTPFLLITLWFLDTRIGRISFVSFRSAFWCVIYRPMYGCARCELNLWATPSVHPGKMYGTVGLRWQWMIDVLGPPPGATT